MKIAIVDDLAQDRAALTARLDDYMESRGLSYEYMEFTDAEQFLSCYQSGIFDIVFMDIYMRGVNGMEAARRIYLQDKDCKIIFLTTTPDFSLQSYSVHAVYYLVKPLEQKSFEQAMEFCSLMPQYPVPFLTVRAGGACLELDTRQIFYIDYMNRTTSVHLKNRVLPVTGSFRSVTSVLEKDSRFLLCIRGLMVNMQHIACQNNDTFLLSNGEHIPINIRSKKIIGQTYRSYIFENIGGKR